MDKKIYGLLLSQDNGINFTKHNNIEVSNYNELYKCSWYEGNEWEADDELIIFTATIPDGRIFIAKHRTIPNGYSEYTYDPEEKWEGMYIDDINNDTLDLFRRYILTEEERQRFSKLQALL